MKPLLVIFVDAYPFTDLSRLTSKLGNGINSAKVKPILGFSINQKAALFAGKMPDEIGFFNEWELRKDDRYVSTIIHKILHIALKPLPQKLQGLCHKIYSRLAKQDFYRIPFEMKANFKRAAYDAYDRKFDELTIIDHLNLKRIIYSDFEKNRDFNVRREAINSILSGEQRLFCAFSNLDALLHKYRNNIEKSDILCEEYAEIIYEIWKKFEYKNPEGDIILLSDHGMANINSVVEVDINALLGRFVQEIDGYFIDATMLRIWCSSEQTQHCIIDMVSKVKGLKFLNSQERYEFGISNKKFGDLIFIIEKDDEMLVPNFYSRTKVNGMHGLLPNHDNQLGVLVTNKVIDFEEISGVNVYNWIMDR